MTTYAIQTDSKPAIVISTNSRRTARRLAKAASTATVHCYDAWERPCGSVQYNYGRRVDVSAVSAVAGIYQRLLTRKHGLVLLPGRDPSAAKRWDSGIERGYLEQHDRVTRKRKQKARIRNTSRSRSV